MTAELKTLRRAKGLTQKQMADAAGISLRSYKSYENDEGKEGSLKYRYLLSVLEDLNKLDEDHGILSLKEIEERCSSVFDKYPVHCCMLFGSYAKGKANEKSDVDLLVISDLKGLEFFALVEELRVVLWKKVDVLDLNQLKDNLELASEVLQYGVRIYSER